MAMPQDMFGLGKKIDLDKDRDAILAALHKVACPPICDDIVDAGIVGALSAEKGTLRIELLLPTPALKGREAFEKSVVDAVKSLASDVELDAKGNVRASAGAPDGKQDL